MSAARSACASSGTVTTTHASDHRSGRPSRISSKRSAERHAERLYSRRSGSVTQRGHGRAEGARAFPGDGSRLPAGDAPHPPLRGEGRGALPRGRPVRVPPRRDRAGGRRGRRLPRARGRRRDRLDASRARAHAREGDAPQRGDGRDVRQGRGVQPRLRRLDAPLRRRAREPRRERRRRRRAPRDHRCRARVQAPRRAARVAVAFFGDGATNIGHVPRVAEPRPALEGSPPSTSARTTATPSRRPPGSSCRSRISPSAQSPTGCTRSPSTARTSRRSTTRHTVRSTMPATARARSSCSRTRYRLTGHYVGDPQVYRPREELHEARRDAGSDREAPCRLDVPDDEWDGMEREVAELVEGSVEFARTAPTPDPRTRWRTCTRSAAALETARCPR